MLSSERQLDSWSLRWLTRAADSLSCGVVVAAAADAAAVAGSGLSEMLVTLPMMRVIFRPALKCISTAPLYPTALKSVLRRSSRKVPWAEEAPKDVVSSTDPPEGSTSFRTTGTENWPIPWAT